MRFWLAVLLLALAGAALGEEATVTVCYNYGCASEAPVSFSDVQMNWVHLLLAGASGPRRERERLALAVGKLYSWAGRQTPIWRDRGGNYDDGGVDGKMDCIDHSTTTTRFLHLIEARGWLRFHRVLEPARRVRFLVAQHLSAQIEEVVLPPGAARMDMDLVYDDFALPGDDARQGPRFVVDSWFVNNGEPAVVMPLEVWMDGGGPDG